jgi:hypothetical protein
VGFILIYNKNTHCLFLKAITSQHGNAAWIESAIKLVQGRISTRVVDPKGCLGSTRHILFGQMGSQGKKKEGARERERERKLALLLYCLQ